MQAKASVGGRLSETVAGRLSFAGTTRDGAFTDVAAHDNLNGLNNLGVPRTTAVRAISEDGLTFAADHTRQRPRGYAQVVAGVAPTLRPPSRQYPRIAADLGYARRALTPSIG